MAQGGMAGRLPHLMTWTCALMTRVLLTVNPSSTLLSSMNFFQPQSCSFLQKRCSVSAQQRHAPSQQTRVHAQGQRVHAPSSALQAVCRWRRPRSEHACVRAWPHT